MASDLETITVVELLESKPDHLETARVVYESWPEVRKRIIGDFLEHLRGLVEAKIKGAPGASVHDVCVKAQAEKSPTTMLKPSSHSPKEPFR